MRPATRMVRDHVLSRWALMGALLLILVITVGEMIHFPGILTPPALIPFYIGIVVLTLGAYGAMSLVATRATSRTADSAFTQALWWGTGVGVLWWIEILEANVWRLPGLWLALFYFGPEIAAYALPGVAAALTARQTGQIRSGLLAGVWSGMLGGILTFLGGSAILWLCNASFLHDPQNMQEFLRSHARGLAPDLQTYIVGDLLAGLMVHLVVIGIVVSAIIGIVGAAIGQTLHAASPHGMDQASAQ